MAVLVADVSREVARQCSVPDPVSWSLPETEEAIELKGFLQDAAEDFLDRFDFGVAPALGAEYPNVVDGKVYTAAESGEQIVVGLPVSAESLGISAGDVIQERGNAANTAEVKSVDGQELTLIGETPRGWMAVGKIVLKDPYYADATSVTRSPLQTGRTGVRLMRETPTSTRGPVFLTGYSGSSPPTRVAQVSSEHDIEAIKARNPSWHTPYYYWKDDGIAFWNAKKATAFVMWMTNEWVNDGGGAPKAEFNEDTDTTPLPRRALVAGAVGRFRRRHGMPHEALFMDADKQFRRWAAAKAAGGLKVVDIGGGPSASPDFWLRHDLRTGIIPQVDIRSNPLE